jgi:exopolyphosphatase/guanosine-5'-triphosphate,3'-diphosphate pyrophosphatase
MMHATRVAFFDIGTNAILLLIVALRPDRGFEVLDDLAEIARLGQGVDHSLRISTEGEGRTVDVLRRYLARCRELGVEECVAVGTSALRDAANSREVRARLKEQLGLEVRVLSGAEEAAYCFLAVQRGLRLGAEALLVIDIGGGSTEFIWGDAGRMRRAASINVGSVRLTERFLRSDPVTDEECARVLTFIDQEVGRVRAKGPQFAESLSLVGLAGTFTTLAAVEKKLARYSHHEVHGSLLTLAEVTRQVSVYRQMPVAERKRIPGLEPKRADVILAGAFLVQRIMQGFGVEEVIVSDQGIRYGLLYERLGRVECC